jgi:hypothetical protein
VIPLNMAKIPDPRLPLAGLVDTRQPGH